MRDSPAAHSQIRSLIDDDCSPSAPATLLIAEDEALVAMVLRDALMDAGYLVLDLTTRHGEAVAAAKASSPDLALVNIHLADGDDGIALAEQLHDLAVPVVFISGQTSRARSAATVAIASMPKPYEAEDMVKAVDYLLARLKGPTTVKPPGGLEVFEMDAVSYGPVDPEYVRPS